MRQKESVAVVMKEKIAKGILFLKNEDLKIKNDSIGDDVETGIVIDLRQLIMPKKKKAKAVSTA